MTPQQLHSAIDARRQDRGLVWWQVAVQLDVDIATLARLRRGTHSPRITKRAPAWLTRSS